MCIQFLIHGKLLFTNVSHIRHYYVILYAVSINGLVIEFRCVDSDGVCVIDYHRDIFINPSTAKLFNLNFHSLKVVSR